MEEVGTPQIVPGRLVHISNTILRRVRSLTEMRSAYLTQKSSSDKLAMAGYEQLARHLLKLIEKHLHTFSFSGRDAASGNPYLGQR